MNKGLLSSILLSGFILSACSIPMQTIAPNPSNPIGTVAVLPMYNATNDVEGPEMVRGLVEKRVQRWQYTSKPINEVDQILSDQMGVTLGSQLELTTPEKLGAALGVDGVLYGYLVDFGDVTTGIYNEKRVRAGFRLVDTKTGKVVWAGGRGVRSSSGALGELASTRDEGIEALKSVKGVAEIPRIKQWDPIGGAADSDFKMAMAGKLLSKATGGYLKSETNVMLDKIFRDFPAGRGTGEVVAAKIPGIAPPPPVANPFMGYMRVGKKDFTADLVMTSVLKKQNRKMVIDGKLAKGGENFRTDIDMSRAMGDQAKGMPAGLSKTAMIWKGREKKQKSYTLYPDLKKYMENPVDENESAEPNVTRKKLGEEVIDGHKCDKVQVEMTSADGKTFRGLIWEAKDLDGFVIKSEFEDGESKQTTELKNVKLVTPPASVFEIPKDYTVAAGYMDLVGGTNE